MKKLLLAGTMAAALISLASFAFAGDYHSGATLYCAECHIMHGSASHGYGGDAAGAAYQGKAVDTYSGGAYPALLKGTFNSVCTQCHDGRGGEGIPDVMGENSAGAGVSREAGALNDAGTTGYQPWMGHTLGSTDAAPGGVAIADGLECISCHHQHGAASGAKDVKGNSVSSAYRNVKTMAGLSISYNTTDAFDATKDVFQRSKTANHYSPSNIDFNMPVAGDSGYAKWCQSCHVNFHANTTDADGAWLRHPTANAVIGAHGSGGYTDAGQWKYSVRGGTSGSKVNYIKVMSDTQAWGKDATNPTPSCFSCHKAHGNKNPFGLIYMAGTGATVTDEGDDGTTNGKGAKNLCKQCHIQG